MKVSVVHASGSRLGDGSDISGAGCGNALRPGRRPVAPALGTALVAGLAFGAMAPAVDGISTVAAQTQKAGYSVRADPFGADNTINGMADAIMGGVRGTRGRMGALFDRLKTSSPSGLKEVSSDGRPPNTAAETMQNGGDCTEFASVVLAAINAMNAKGAGIKAAALVVHFRSAPDDRRHMIICVDIGGKQTIIDPQAPGLGETKDGDYDVILTLTPDVAAAVYHREYGDYYRDAGKPRMARVAYERSLEIFDGDAYVHQNAGTLCRNAGNMEAAERHFERANELIPGRYARDAAKGSYNLELRQAQKAYEGGDWAGAQKHFIDALSLGKGLKHDDSTTINEYINDCIQRLK